MDGASDSRLDVDTRTFSMIRLWPWLRLFRCAGVAMDARKLILCGIGLLVFTLGRNGFALFVEGSVELRLPILPALDGDAWLRSPAQVMFAHVAWPWRVLSEPFALVFSPESDLREFGLALLTAIWGVLVWGFFGGASARVAMLDLARRERVGIGGAIKFAGKRLLPLVGAPLSPLIGLAFFASLCGVFGLVWYRYLGEVGETIGGVLFFLPLIAGLVMALIVVGLAVGWPLMVQTVAAESQDAFDALSRSYSYVYQRPWKLGFYVLVSLFVGAVGYAFVLLVATLTIRLAVWGVTFGGSSQALSSSMMTGHHSLLLSKKLGEVPVQTHRFWWQFVSGLAFTYLFSYFWTATAMIYLLLRNDVDGAEFDDVYREGEEAEPFVPEPQNSGNETPST